jgi:hypothetical protein
MPKMRGLLRPKPTISEEEMAFAQERMAVRLEAIFGGGVPGSGDSASAGDISSDGVETPDTADVGAASASEPADPRATPGGHRPSIVVEGDAGLVGGQRDGGQVRLVGVMARPEHDAAGDGWDLPFTLATPTPSTPMQTAPDPGLDDAPGPDVEPVAASAEPVVTTLVDVAPAADATIAEPVRRSHRGSRATGSAGVHAHGSQVARTTRRKVRAAPVPTALCPYCALVLEPPPVASRRCGRCRQRICVKRIEGRRVYLTEAAVLVFDAERRREASSGRLTRERGRWLRLAAAAGAPADRQARLAAMLPSEAVVASARALYVATVERAFRAAKRDHEWEEASRIRREHATALYRLARSPLPPPSDLVALFREGVVAELRGIAEISRDAQMVSAGCCDACRADDRQIFRIATELRAPRLPHEACPRGLCRCRWDLAARDRTAMRRYLRRHPKTGAEGVPQQLDA